MSQLHRQRRAHDLWISRSHVVAAVLIALFTSVGAFSAGYLMGQGEPKQVEQVAFVDQIADDRLVQLLARVESAQAPDGGVRILTFPDQLTGASPPPIPDVESPDRNLVVEPVDVNVPDAGDAPPRGRWTLVVQTFSDEKEARLLAESLVEKGQPAWVAPELVEGELQHRVGLGGWGSKSEAAQALPSLRRFRVRDVPLRVQRF